ncbi:hypothetical protein DB30_00510 [Enhygromyxa salina]|uniref:Cupin type-2 domain-containing protein n=1 Tax=Enhygromyxa salina TaxID=215803 RepID=A0A0C2CZ36_9BACT|nr:hypothetical protein DB30_00510 [Enhygromyxa salina]
MALQTSAATDAPAEGGGANDPAPAEPSAVQATVVALADAPSFVAPNGTATITHLALGQNAYLGRLRMDAGAAVPVHRDPTEEYIHVLEGSGTMTIDGETHELGPGTTIYMPANAEVSFQNGDAEMIGLQVFAGPEPAAKYQAWTPTP